LGIDPPDVAAALFADGERDVPMDGNAATGLARQLETGDHGASDVDPDQPAVKPTTVHHEKHEHAPGDGWRGMGPDGPDEATTT